MGSVTSDFNAPDVARYEGEESAYVRAIEHTVDLLLTLVTESHTWGWGDGEGGWLFQVIDDKAAERGLVTPREHSRRPILNRLLDRDGPLCAYCEAPTSLVYPDPHIDHVVPRSRGGGNELSNLVIACPRCNMAKGSKLLEDWRR